jgi:hypothetical protein
MAKNPGQNGPDGAAAGEKREEREKEEPRVPAEGLDPQAEVFFERFARVLGGTLRPERPAPTPEAIEATERFKELVCELAFPELPAPRQAEAQAAPEAHPAGRAEQAPLAEKPAERPPRVEQQA